MTEPTRCGWATRSEAERVYHDVEWGVPKRDEGTLFEFLILEGAQAGLSWRTILEKRENYRAAMDGFDPEAMARYGETERARLLGGKWLQRVLPSRDPAAAAESSAQPVVAAVGP
ncbi:DNA-3-methyladenine glycosylase I, partial [Algiphilus sp.]|uniref:DNA-3-methyladenine glycosylase I n=1 Tax=Algiphilus sp. TaxID=1872431 RepID=UPI003C48ABFA